MAMGKLTAAIAGANPSDRAALRSALQKTGLVDSALEWAEPSAGEWRLSASERIPEVVLLDLPRETEVAFFFANELRRLRPSVRIIACAEAESRLDPDLLLQAMRAGIQDFLNKPVSLETLKETLERFLKDRDGESKSEVSKVTVVMGAKGGVGTTTVAVNLGVQIARFTRKRVALVDFGKPLGEVSLLLDLRPRFSIRDAVENLDRLDGHFLEKLVDHHKSGLQVLAGVSSPDDWQKLPVPDLARLVNRTQNYYDHLLIDFGSVYTSEWKPVLEPARDILIVAEADVPALWPLERHLVALSSMGIAPSRIRIVINRWHRQDDEALKSVEKLAKRPIFARIPNDFRHASRANNMGVPLVEDRVNGLASKYDEMARQLAGPAPSAGGVK